MNTMIWLLALTGMFTIAIGITNFVIKLSEASTKRKFDIEQHRSAVLESLNRIEATIKQQSKTSQP